MALVRTTAAVIDSLRGEPDGLTRAQLVERSRLSRPTVSNVVNVLLRQGLLQDVGGEDGPNAGRVALAPASGVFVGIDLGHGHVACAIGTGGAMVIAGPRSSGPVDVDGLGPAALKPAMKLVRALLAESGVEPAHVAGIGVGLPAPLTFAGAVASSLYLQSFVAVDIADEVVAAFRKEFGANLSPDVRCENDANLGALGETSLGVARGYRHAVYVKVSTGIGAGVLLNGEIWRGGHGVAGEFGHSAAAVRADELLVPAAERCDRCRQAWCLENTVSARALIAQFRRRAPELYPESKDFDEVIDAVLAKPSEHALARQILLRAGERIGCALADVVRVLDPEAVILGGKLARAGDLVAQPMTEAVERAGVGGYKTKVLLVEPAEVRFSEARGSLVLAIRTASAKRLV